MATEVGQQANDQGQLNAMLDRVEATAGAAPDAVLADAGYCSEEALTALETVKVLSRASIETMAGLFDESGW